MCIRDSVELRPHGQLRCGHAAAVWRFSSLIVFAPFTSLGGDQLAELLLVEFVGDLQRHQ